MTLDELRDEVAQFAKDRDWDQFHSVRNLVLAIMAQNNEMSHYLYPHKRNLKSLPESSRQ